ncbi:MAG: hypothetical protein WCK65_10800 [Rhodospirillaceae bacterium]
MNIPFFLFLIVLAVILGRSNHTPAAFLVIGVVVAVLVVAPFLHRLISADRIEGRPRFFRKRRRR